MTFPRETVAQELAPFDPRGVLAEVVERSFDGFEELLRTVDDAIGGVLDARARGVEAKHMLHESAALANALAELRELTDRYLAQPCLSASLSDSVIEMRERAINARAHLIEATTTEVK